MVVGKVELDKKGDIVTVKLGVPGWHKGMPSMLYRIEFKAEAFKNVSMELGKQWKTAKYPEWPPVRVGDKYVLVGSVCGFPWDSFELKNPEYIKVGLLPYRGHVNSFDFYFNGKLKQRNVTSVKYEVIDYGIPCAVLGSILGYFIGQKTGDPVVSGAIGAGAGFAAGKLIKTVEITCF